MSAGVLLAVLFGAFLHASWNVLVKAGHDTSVAVAGVYIGAGVLSAIALPFLPAPSAASWPYLAVSTVVEVLYAFLLAAAYRLGDLSHAYPLMRGTAPLLVAIGSGALIGEPLSGAVYAGVALVSAGGGSLVLCRPSPGGSPPPPRAAPLSARAPPPLPRDHRPPRAAPPAR